MANDYKPDPIGTAEDLGQLLLYLQQELNKVSGALAGSLSSEVPMYDAPPVKIRERMMVVADGVNWDPGSGKGAYIFLSGDWIPVAVIGTLPGEGQLPPPAEEPEEPPPEDPPQIFLPEGFGKIATGGTGQPNYDVNTLRDSGSGSLRDALSQGNRNVTFSVGGDINLASNLTTNGQNITVDGLTAPSPGITLRGRQFGVQGFRGAHNIILRGFRSRDSSGDGINVFGAERVLLDRLSIHNFTDGAIDVTEHSKDVTLQWCILGEGISRHNFQNLTGYSPLRVSLLNNLYIQGVARMPLADYESVAAPEIVVDVRNNLMWNVRQEGSAFKQGAKANVVNNFYYGQPGTSARETSMIVLQDGSVQVYVSGNYSHNGWNINKGNRATPHAAVLPAVTFSAIAAAHRVREHVGCRGGANNIPLDAIDQAYLNSITGLPPL